MVALLVRLPDQYVSILLIGMLPDQSASIYYEKELVTLTSCWHLRLCFHSLDQQSQILRGKYVKNKRNLITFS